jgi:KDEL-tailed cysteine endopeptidase
MFKSFAAVAFTGVATASVSPFEFMQYISKHGKSYPTLEEFNMRMELFNERNAIINEHNSDETATSQMGHNFISDYTNAEKANLSGLKADFMPQTEAEVFVATNAPIANSINWVTAGKVGAVKDQGQCGSCWAFSATGSMESAVAISTGRHVGNYSEQQLVDCSSSYGNNGCSGGWYYWAWEYLKVTGQDNTSSYPYFSGAKGKTGTCNASGNSSVKVQNYVKVGTQNSDIMAALNKKPVSVAIDATKAVFQSYTSGVVTAGCGRSLDHAVMAVGYGTDAATGLDYFLVRNSWGSSWGDNGYIKIGQSSTGGSPGYCGINKEVYYVNATA